MYIRCENVMMMLNKTVIDPTAAGTSGGDFLTKTSLGEKNQSQNGTPTRGLSCSLPIFRFYC